jgi:hypothetical protein
LLSSLGLSVGFPPVNSKFEQHPRDDCSQLEREDKAGGLISAPAPHILIMAQWQKTREPKKTKAELYEMLAEAVRNTAQPEIKRPRSPKKIAGKSA